MNVLDERGREGEFNSAYFFCGAAVGNVLERQRRRASLRLSRGQHQGRPRGLNDTLSFSERVHC